MSILKENYEKFILSIVLFTVIFGLIERLRSSNSEIFTVNIEQIQKYKIDIEHWNSVGYSLNNTKNLLNPGWEVFSFDKTVFCPYGDCDFIINFDSPKCIFCGRFVLIKEVEVAFAEDFDSDGLSNKKEYEFGLNSYQAKDLFNDNDKDGFSNKIEIDERADINDINDYPPLVWRLSFVKSTRSYLRLILKAIYTNGKIDKTKWEVNIAVDSKNRYYKLGDTVYKGYKIIDLKSEKYVNAQGGHTRDVTVILQKEGQESFEIYLNKRVYPPKSRKYYFLYEKGKEKKAISTYEGASIVLQGEDGKTEEYDILKYEKELELIVLVRNGDYYSVKGKSILAQKRALIVGDKSVKGRANENSKLELRTTL